MKKSFTKVVKSVSKSRPLLAGVHYTNDRMELTDSYVAIIEKFKTPLNNEMDMLIGLNGVPSEVNYPDLSRIVPRELNNSFIVDLPIWEAVTKAYKKEPLLKLEKDGTIKGQKVGTFDKLEGFEYIAMNPKYMLILAEYAKESGKKKEITIKFDDSAVKPAVIEFEEQETTNIFVITPIRTQKDVKA